MLRTIGYFTYGMDYGPPFDEQGMKLCLVFRDACDFTVGVLTEELD